MCATKAELGVIMALQDESQGLFEQANIPVYYCGIGKINATLATADLIFRQGCRHIVNLGTAGSPVFTTHSLIECNGLVQRDMDLTPLGFPLGETPFDTLPGLITIERFFTNLPQGVCGSGDNFVQGVPPVACDLVDMEAYAIAKVCQKLGVGFTAIKYISDGSDHNAHNDWASNLPSAAAALLNSFQTLAQQWID